MTIDVERGEIVNKFTDGYGTSLPPYQWNCEISTNILDTAGMLQTDHTAVENHQVIHTHQCKGHSGHEFRIQPEKLKKLGFKFKDKRKIQLDCKANARDKGEEYEFETDRIYETLNNEYKDQKFGNGRLLKDSQTDKSVLTSVQSNLSKLNGSGMQTSQKQQTNGCKTENPFLKSGKRKLFLTQNESFQNSTGRNPDSLDNFNETFISIENATVSSNYTDYENDFTVINDTLEDDVFDSVADEVNHSNYYENIVYKCKCKTENKDLYVDKDKTKATDLPRYGIISDRANNKNDLFLGGKENLSYTSKEGYRRNELNESCNIIKDRANYNIKRNKCKIYSSNYRAKASPGKICEAEQEISRTKTNIEKNNITYFCKDNKIDVESSHL